MIKKVNYATAYGAGLSAILDKCCLAYAFPASGIISLECPLTIYFLRNSFLESLKELTILNL